MDYRARRHRNHLKNKQYLKQIHWQMGLDTEPHQRTRCRLTLYKPYLGFCASALELGVFCQKRHELHRHIPSLSNSNPNSLQHEGVVPLYARPPLQV